MSKAATKKAGSTKRKFTVDYSVPANDGVFDGAAFEEYLKERIKVEGKTGNLGEKVKVSREGNKVVIAPSVPLSKRYVKYLTKKYLKKNTLRDWIRVIATSKEGFQLRFYNIAPGEDAEDDDE
ncbi:ribosomal protein L22e [Schizopora paradoxa]|uniref:Ribosomal protein L22e n=1 Tax=Schizopora paradoxa TaxID=27342 RepID=A0A0H2SES3_9AGAM|nr:ribosomal protein L22e [Schizopora paradoxa]